jgi:hypothetical protein
LGIDTFYIPRDATLALIKVAADLELREIISSWISRSEVYVIGPRSERKSWEHRGPVH